MDAPSANVSIKFVLNAPCTVSYYFEEIIMAKKKPAAKITAKKPVAKTAVKKAASSKEKTMAKKAPAKKVAASAKKVEKKTNKPSLLKSAAKFVGKVAKGLSKDQLKKAKEKEAKEKKALAAQAAKEKAQAAKDKEKAKALEAKEKAAAAKDKVKNKEAEKKQKEALKAKEKADKEALKAKSKSDKDTSKKKTKKFDDDEDEDGDDEDVGDEVFEDEEEGVEAKPKRQEDDDFDEFEEDYKKSKAAPKKSGKKAYESEDGRIEVFEPKKSKKYENQVLADLEGKIADEIAELREHFNWKDITEAIGTMDFFIDAKNDECIEKGCDNIRTTQSYCRLHYLRNWKVVQKKRDILKEGKLQEYIEELISKYPVKYIEALLSDLSDDKEFYKVLNELNITSEFDFEEDEFENAADDDDGDDDIAIESISSSIRYEDE
jgi:hypothetical protein